MRCHRPLRMAAGCRSCPTARIPSELIRLKAWHFGCRLSATERRSSTAEHLPERREPRHVVAYDLERNQNGDGEERAGHAPEPSPEDEAEKDDDRVKREPLAEEQRGDQLTFERGEREESRRD